MVIIIDAYNVLKQRKETLQATDAQKNQFIKMLQAYAKKKKHMLVVVFDGGPYRWPTATKASKQVTVVYSGYVDSADDYIIEDINKNKHRDLLVISSDREVRNAAQKVGIPSVRSHQFYNIVQTVLQDEQAELLPGSGHSVVKTTQGDDPELDILMQEGVVPNKDMPQENNRRPKKHVTVSKKDRALQQLLKKLL